MCKVIFIIVPSFSNSNWLNDKMMQITESFVSILNFDNFPIYKVKNYNDINNFLNQADLLIIATAGVVIIERDHLWKKIKEFPSDIGLMTHILQFEHDITPYMHEQFFIINTKAISHVDLEFIDTYDDGLELIRSDEDMHDGHAPLFVTIGNKIVKRNLKFGTTLIEQCLLNGYKVRNFDSEWRYPRVSNDYFTLDNVVLPSKGFCYPTKSTEIFEKSLKELKIYPGLDEAQELFINAVNKILEFNVLNYWHYDQIPNVKNLDHVICPATGFLAEMIAVKSGAKKITFYDKNRNNVDFKKHLYKKWDGLNYNGFAKQWAAERHLALEPSFDLDIEKSNFLALNTEKELFEIWNTWKEEIEINFIYGDLLEENAIVDSITENSIISTSTILGIYPFTAILYDSDKIEKTKLIIQEKISLTNSLWLRS